MDIRDIPYEDVREFLLLHTDLSISIEKNYQTAEQLIISNNYDNLPDNIQYWLKARDLPDVAHNLSDLHNSNKENLYEIKMILKYGKKLYDDLPQTTRISLKGQQQLYGCQLEKAPANLIYVGRKFTMGGWNLIGSDFANPYKAGDDRNNALQQYKKYIIKRLKTEPELLRKLYSYAGCVLACWCKPNENCHAQILIDLIHEK